MVFCVVQLSADLCAGLFHSGGSFHIRGFEPILSLLLFVSALALHSRQLDLKLRLDFLWAVQVRKCVPVCVFLSVCVAVKMIKFHYPKFLSSLLEKCCQFSCVMCKLNGILCRI